MIGGVIFFKGYWFLLLGRWFCLYVVLKVEVFFWFSLGMFNMLIVDKIKLLFENKEKEMDEELKFNFVGVLDEDGFDFVGLLNVSIFKG